MTAVCALAAAFLSVVLAASPACAQAADIPAAGARHAEPSHGSDPHPTAEPGARYLAQVRADFTPENRSYWTTRTALSFISPFYQVAVALLLLFSGASAAMSRFAAARSRGRYGRALVYLALFLSAGFVLGFPLDWYRGFVLEHQYGLSNQSFLAWLGDQGKDVLVSYALLGATGLVALAYLAIERSPRRWWLWLGLGTLPVVVTGVLIQPLVIDPLYNKFTPLRDQQLKGEILALAAQAGIPGRNVYQVDKSKQTKKYNAYVNGFGASQRIVLWDTTLEGMERDEILFVMGHEMGHYKLAHIWKGILFYSAASFALFFFVRLLGIGALSRFGARWRIREPHDLATLPLFLAAAGLVSLVGDPVGNGYSRRIEHEADRFAIEVTRLNDAGARAFIKLGSQNKSNPEPPALVKHFRYTHPPLVERIRFALAYRPWEGKPGGS